MKVISILCVISWILLSGCSGGIDISSDWDPEADFRNLKTYQFAERISTEDDDIRIYNDMTIKRIRNALNTSLQERGFELSTSGEPDFKVGWHGSINQKMNMATIHNDYYYSAGYYTYLDIYSPHAKTYVNEWDEGTLIIDIVDPKKNVLIWRGTGTALVEEDVERSAADKQKGLNKAVAKILKKFPPKQ